MDRASYATVAEMVVTVVDTHRRTGDRHEDLVTAYDERYRRFAAFRRELQSAAATSTRHGQ